MSKIENIIDGFSFASASEALQAAKETEGIRYIQQKTELDDPGMVLQIYNKMVSQELFETAVGYTYLKRLQDYLLEIPEIRDKDILPIPVHHPAFQKEIYEEDQQKTEPAEETDDKKEESVEKVTERTRKDSKITHIDYKKRYQVMTVISSVLAVCIIAMFIIAGTSGSTNILNYENKLIDKYEAWEQELEQREAALTEREQQLGQY